MPMTHDSHIASQPIGLKLSVMASPRKATVDFIRQFARTTAVLDGTAFCRMNVN